jgi:hypothetical protein
MLRAIEQIHRMRGGAQSHLMRCVDERGEEHYYAVKFQNNPQHRRILVNELPGTRLATKLGLPTPRVGMGRATWTPLSSSAPSAAKSLK